MRLFHEDHTVDLEESYFSILVKIWYFIQYKCPPPLYKLGEKTKPMCAWLS